MSMIDVTQEVIPETEYRYGKFAVIARLDSVGVSTLKAIVEHSLGEDAVTIKLSDIEVKLMESSTFLQDKLRYNPRNSTVEIVVAKEVIDVFTVGYRVEKTVKDVIAVLNKSRKNTLPKSFDYYREGVTLCLKVQKNTRFSPVTYNGVLFNGRVYVTQLVAQGATIELASKLVVGRIDEMVELLNTRDQPWERRKEM